MTTSERRKIVCSVTFHVIAITCVVWSLYVLIDRTAEEIKQGNDNGKYLLPSSVLPVSLFLTNSSLIQEYIKCFNAEIMNALVLKAYVVPLQRPPLSVIITTA